MTPTGSQTHLPRECRQVGDWVKQAQGRTMVSGPLTQLAVPCGEASESPSSTSRKTRFQICTCCPVKVSYQKLPPSAPRQVPKPHLFVNSARWSVRNSCPRHRSYGLPAPWDARPQRPTSRSVLGHGSPAPLPWNAEGLEAHVRSGEGVRTTDLSRGEKVSAGRGENHVQGEKLTRG